MLAVLVGLLLGVGLLLVVTSVMGTPMPRVRPPHFYVRWSDLMTRSGIQGLTVGRLLFLSLTAALVVLVAVFAWSRSLTVSTVIAVCIIPVPSAFVGMRSRQRAKNLRSVWPEVVDSLVSGVRAGASLPDLLIDLSETAPDELRPYFAEFVREYRASGRFDSGLNVLKRRLADPVADRIVEALRLAREVGGADLSLILRDLAVMLRDDARIRGELEARQSWTVNAARLGIAAPWLVLVMISGQEQAARAYSTPQGLMVLGAGAILSLAAYMIMQRVGRLSVDERALR